MKEHWIWLSCRRNLRMQTAVTLIQTYGDAETVYSKEREDYIAIEGIRKAEVDALCDKSLDAAREILRTAFMWGISSITYDDVEYPERLRNIADPPMVLYYLGYLPDFDRVPGIAIVGTRKASAYGCQIAYKLGQEIGDCGGLVISGMAAGIDSAAMSGAVSRDHPAVGVLGGGLDIMYPAATVDLRMTVEKKGCLISEYPPGTPPTGRNFPKRNRLISGLACGVVVVEAPKGSGALITAEHALEQNRDIFAVPGNVGAVNSTGCNELLAKGAHVAQYGWDVMQLYQHLYPHCVGHKVGYKDLSKIPGMDPIVLDPFPKQKVLVFSEDSMVPETAAAQEEPQAIAQEEPQEPVDKEPETTYSEWDEVPEGLPEDEKRILQVLQGRRMQVDEIIAESQLTSGQVLAALTLLEVKGLVTRHPGKFYSRSKDIAVSGK